MYRVYLDKNVIHAPDDSDYPELVVVNPTLNLELNKAATFEFSIEPTHPYYDKLERFKSIIQILQDDFEEIFKGRIVEITDDMYKERTVYCESELAYLNDTIQRPAEFHLEGSAVYKYLQAVIGEHNAQVDDSRTFELGEISINDPNDYIYCYTNYNSTMEEIKEDLVDDLGGYIRVRNEYRNNNPLGTLTGRYIDYVGLEEYGRTSEQYIEFGENLLDFTNDINQADICTGIIPLGATLDESQYAAIDERVTIKSVNSDSDYIYIPEAVEKYGLILKVVTWDDITEPKNLLAAAENYLAEYDYEPQTIEATAVDMHLTDEEIEAWRLGDKIFVESTPHDLHKRFPLASMSIPLDQPENTSVTLGTYEDSSLSARTNRTEAGLRNFEDIQVGNVIASAVAQASALIKARTYGYVTVHYDEDRGCVDELLIMDTDDIDTATRVWRWNLNGLGYSSNGYGGDYGLAITMNGWILGSFIIANGMILADDSDVEFAKFTDKGMEIYAQSGRSDLLLMSIGREGLTLYDDTGKNVLATFYSDGVKIYNTSGSVLMRLNASGLTVNNSSETTLMTLNSNGLRIYNSSGVLRSSMDSDSFDIYDSSENLLMTLSSSGARYYYNGNLVGNIGTTYWTGHESNRGLMFGLENSAAFMSFGWKQTSSTSTYTAMIAYHTPNSSETQGVHFGDNVIMRNYLLYFGTSDSGAYLQAESNGGLIINGGTLYIEETGYYQGYEIANQQWVLEQIPDLSGIESDISNLSSSVSGLQSDVSNINSSLGNYVQQSDSATITIKTSDASANGNFSFSGGAEIDISELVGGGSGGDITCDSLEWDTGFKLGDGGIYHNDTLILYSGDNRQGIGSVESGGWNFGGRYVEIGSDFNNSLSERTDIYSSGTMTINPQGKLIIFSNDDDVDITAGARVLLGYEAYSMIVIGINSTSSVYIQGSAFTNSDARLKTSIQPLTASTLDNLTPVSFKWRDGDDRTHYGYIAQDVREHIPELVSEGSDGMLGLAYTEIIPLLHCKIKEQQTQIDELEQRIARLEALIYGKKESD